MTFERDLLNPDMKKENQKHKTKRLIPTPNSNFILIICPRCSKQTRTFSHAKIIVKCNNCQHTLLKPSSGKAVIDPKATFTVIN